MSEPGKAVFLSYASQDADAAKRICEALHAAGVEVWFDQSELVGGDAWDQKIRKQIRECALFVPVISINTNARAEGYFRREWKQAVERTHDMADDVPFLFPVVLGEVADGAARVPDKFREVQWTRLRLDETPAELGVRVAKLLSVGSSVGGALRPDSSRESGRKAPPTSQTSRWHWWMIFPVVGTLIGLGFAVLPLWKAFQSSPTRRAPPPVSASAAQGAEARQHVAKVWGQLNKPELARAQLEAADGSGRRATELDPNDADAWAAWSQVDSWMVYHNFDASAARREAARTKVARALQLAPDSYESRLAQACYLVRGQAGGDATLSIYAGEAEKLLRALLKEKRDEPRALLTLGILLRNTGAFPEARELFGRLADDPASAALAWNELGWAEYIAGDYMAAGVAIDKSIALQAYWGNLTLKQVLAQWWLGDLDRAKAAQDQMPVAARQEDIGVYLAVELAHWRREPQIMLQILRGVSRDWLQSNGFIGPTAWYAALAHQMAGQEAAAQVQWRAALAVVERRLATQPDSGFLIHWKGTLLAALGNRADAEPLLKLAHEIGSSRSDSIDDATALIWSNRPDAAIAVLDRMAALEKKSVTAAAFRLNPVLNPLRTQPRFQALLARLEAAPRFSPTANTAKPANGAGVADQNSVAVLAFANLSDDKANEYFSDGVSEELLNVLAKVQGLKVSARTSAFHFKGKDTPIPEIARQLGVAYVVEGSVRKQGDKVRITAQLIKAADGFHVWSDTFTRDLKDIFAVQDEIAALISQQLQLKLGAATRPARVVNPEAYRLLLQARAILNRGVTAEVPQAIQLLKDSLAIDDSALAWSLLAMNYIGGASQGALPAAEGYNLGRDAANRAIALDPELPLGHAALAGVQFIRDWDWAAASASLQHARDLAPGDAGILAYSCNLAQTLGQTEQALQWGQRAVELDPLGFLPGYVLGKAHFQAGQYAEMERLAEQMIAVSPAGRYGHVYLVYARLLQGKVEAAAQALERMSPDMFQLTCAALVRHSQGRPAESEAALRALQVRTGWGAAYQIAEIHAWRNEMDQAFEWLETAYRERDAGMTWLLNDPFLQKLRGDSRWPTLLKRMNLPLPSK